MDICNRWTKEIIYSSPESAVDLAILDALSQHIDLSRTYLSRSNLSGADLSRADLSGADLSGANLSGADLSGADLSGADLSGANLSMADLSMADLSGADLSGANLSDATTKCVSWPAPTMVLLAFWETVSDDLCLELMRFDASNHPNPQKFLDWVETGNCPYDGEAIQRAANFKEQRELYSPGPSKSAYELMLMLLKEKCIEE